jgi:hypothetical protein
MVLVLVVPFTPVPVVGVAVVLSLLVVFTVVTPGRRPVEA